MADHLDVRQMVAADPKGPERGARPEEASLQERVAEQFRVRWGYAETNELVKRYARDAIDVLRPELEQITFERDAAQQAADVLCDQLKDLRDDVLGDESLLVPEIVSAAGRTVERLTAETTQLRADLRIRQGALNDVLGRERSADYYSAVEDVAELKRENGRLTAEVERLRDATDRVVELEHDADRVRDALLPILRGHRYTQHEVQGDWLRSGYVAERAANLLRRDAAVENSLRGERDRAVSLARDLTEERDEWKQAAGAEADLLDQANAEVSRLREQLATAAVLPQDEDVVDAMRVAVGRKGDERDEEAVSAVLDFLRSWGVSSSEAEAPRPQEMTQHRVNIDRARWDDRVSFAACRDCPEKCCGDPSDVEFWRDRHQADTLRPTLTNESFISSQDEGRPSGFEAAPPRPVETFDCKQDCPAVAPECFCVGPDAHRICCHTVAAQAARSEATPQDPLAVVATETEPSGAVMTECPDGAQCHRECVAPACIRVATCGPMSRVFPSDRWPHEVVAKHGPGSLTEDPSPSLRKEGEDRG